jgi:hypothetical protein
VERESTTAGIDDLCRCPAGVFESLRLPEDDTDGLAGLLVESELRGRPDAGIAALELLPARPPARRLKVRRRGLRFVRLWFHVPERAPLSTVDSRLIAQLPSPRQSGRLRAARMLIGECRRFLGISPLTPRK